MFPSPHASKLELFRQKTASHSRDTQRRFGRGHAAPQEHAQAALALTARAASEAAVKTRCKVSEQL